MTLPPLALEDSPGLERTSIASSKELPRLHKWRECVCVYVRERVRERERDLASSKGCVPLIACIVWSWGWSPTRNKEEHRRLGSKEVPCRPGFVCPSEGDHLGRQSWKVGAMQHMPTKGNYTLSSLVLLQISVLMQVFRPSIGLISREDHL